MTKRLLPSMCGNSVRYIMPAERCSIIQRPRTSRQIVNPSLLTLALEVWDAEIGLRQLGPGVLPASLRLSGLALFLWDAQHRRSGEARGEAGRTASGA